MSLSCSVISVGKACGFRGGICAVVMSPASWRMVCPAMSVRVARLSSVAGWVGEIGPVRMRSPRSFCFVSVPHISRRVHVLL